MLCNSPGNCVNNIYVIQAAGQIRFIDTAAVEIATSIFFVSTVKILKIGTPEIITIIVLQLEQLDFTVQYCVQKMQTE